MGTCVVHSAASHGENIFVGKMWRVLALTNSCNRTLGRRLAIWFEPSPPHLNYCGQHDVQQLVDNYAYALPQPPWHEGQKKKKKRGYLYPDDYNAPHLFRLWHALIRIYNPFYLKERVEKCLFLINCMHIWVGNGWHAYILYNSTND